MPTSRSGFIHALTTAEGEIFGKPPITISGGCNSEINARIFQKSIVEPLYRVRGTKGLRVVDASVIPILPAGNGYAFTLMVAEKASDLIKDASASKLVSRAHVCMRNLSAYGHTTSTPHVTSCMGQMEPSSQIQIREHLIKKYSPNSLPYG
ncbi:hypothetical protein TNCV_73591 [Trichonephila clavipes]|nr:hypothetical protein TNCV_73591 [Trichonephila clavipes]